MKLTPQEEARRAEIKATQEYTMVEILADAEVSAELHGNMDEGQLDGVMIAAARDVIESEANSRRLGLNRDERAFNTKPKGETYVTEEYLADSLESAQRAEMKLVRFIEAMELRRKLKDERKAAERRSAIARSAAETRRERRETAEENAQNSADRS